MSDNLLPVVPDKRQPTKADYRRYKNMLTEIHADIEFIEQALLRLGRNLKAIRDRQLYFCGGYATFADFCQKELGNSRQQVYRLIQAHDVLQSLLEAGIAEQDLPQSERLCREIRKLEPEEQSHVWKAVMRQVKQRGTPPTVIDVQRIAVEEVNNPGAIQERQQSELIQKFEGVSRALKIGLHVDTLTPKFRRRLVVTLTDIAETVAALIRMLHPTAQQGESNHDGGRKND